MYRLEYLHSCETQLTLPSGILLPWQQQGSALSMSLHWLTGTHSIVLFLGMYPEALIKTIGSPNHALIILNTKSHDQINIQMQALFQYCSSCPPPPPPPPPPPSHTHTHRHLDAVKFQKGGENSNGVGFQGASIPLEHCVMRARNAQRCIHIHCVWCEHSTAPGH